MAVLRNSSVSSGCWSSIFINRPSTVAQQVATQTRVVIENAECQRPLPLAAVREHFEGAVVEIEVPTTRMTILFVLRRKSTSIFCGDRRISQSPRSTGLPES